MENQEISNLLTNIGLNNLEKNCYLELLKKSPGRASDIAKKLGVPKATVLIALCRLSNTLGVIKRSKNKNTFLFWLEDVSDLLKYLRRKEEKTQEHKRQLEKLLPEMRARMNLDATKPKIIYLEGRDGLKQTFEKVLEEADEIIGYGSNEDEVKYLPGLYPNYYERRVKKKISVKAIIPATEFNKRGALEGSIKQLRNTRLIPAEFNYPIQVNIYKNSVVFFSFEESFALTIKSRPITACLKKIFEMAFEKAGETDKQIREAKT